MEVNKTESKIEKYLNSDKKRGKRYQNSDQKRLEDVLVDSGLIEAYDHFLRLLCRHGCPVGDIYEYAAQQMEKFQKKKKTLDLKRKAELEIQKAAKKGQDRER